MAVSLSLRAVFGGLTGFAGFAGSAGTEDFAAFGVLTGAGAALTADRTVGLLPMLITLGPVLARVRGAEGWNSPGPCTFGSGGVSTALGELVASTLTTCPWAARALDCCCR